MPRTNVDELIGTAVAGKVTQPSFRVPAATSARNWRRTTSLASATRRVSPMGWRPARGVVTWEHARVLIHCDDGTQDMLAVGDTITVEAHGRSVNVAVSLTGNADAAA